MDAVSEFHGVIDLDDSQPIWGFQQVYGKQAFTNHLSGLLTQFSDLERDGADPGAGRCLRMPMGHEPHDTEGSGPAIFPPG